MDKKKIILLLSIPFLVGCSNQNSGQLEIPTVDVEHISLNLPNKPEFNKGPIKSSDGYDYIDIYEISDFHGAVNLEVGTDEVEVGLSRLSQYLANKREENKGGTILLSGGDMWQGSAESNLTRGYVVTHSMNYMGFDTMTLGNHEFDWTDEWIKKNKGISDFEYLCANLRTKDTKELPDFVKKSKIVTRGDYKIGIIGTIGNVEYSIIPSSIQNYEFMSERDIVSEEAKRLKETEKCNLVIWSSHYAGASIPTTIPNVDAYFGGHAHVSYDNGTIPPCLATQDYGVDLAHAQFKINKETKEVTCNRESTGIIDFCKEGINSSFKEDDNVKSIVEQYAAETNKVKAIEIGSSDGDLKLDNELANLCVKAMTLAANQYCKNNNLSYDVMAGFHNKKGGIRSDIAKGTIKYGDVYSSFPFDNQIVIIPIEGKNVKSKFNSPELNSQAIYHTFEKFNELDDNKTYYYCTNDYVAQSRLKLTEKDYIQTYTYVRDVVAQYIKNQGNIQTSKYDRSNNSEYKIPLM